MPWNLEGFGIFGWETSQTIFWPQPDQGGIVGCPFPVVPSHTTSFPRKIGVRLLKGNWILHISVGWWKSHKWLCVSSDCSNHFFHGMNLRCPIQLGEFTPNSTLQCLQSTKCTPFVFHAFVGPHICGTRYQPFYATCAPQLCSSAVPLLSSVNVSTAAPHSLNLSSSPPWHRITALPAILPAIFPPQHALRASPALSGWWVNAAFL